MRLTSKAVFEDELLVRYLLGDLSEEREAELEREFFSDDELFERFLAAEADLTDAYARGEMSAADRERFEKRLLASPRRLEDVQFAQALAKMPSREPSAGSAPSLEPGSSGRLPGAVKRALAISLAIAALLLVGFSWLLMNFLEVRRENAQLEQGQAALQRHVADLEQQQLSLQAEARQAAARVNVSPEETRPRQDRSVGSLPRESRTVSFLLITGLLRDTGESNRLRIPRDAETVILKIGLDRVAHSNYRAVLQKVSGVEVWKGSRLSVLQGKDGSFLAVKIPTSRLAPGDYILELRGETADGRLEQLPSCSFRVLKP